MTSQVKCPISDCVMDPVFVETVLGKHKVQYYYSNESGLLKTEKPYWLDEAYQEAIAGTDTGILHRNIYNSMLLDVILNFLKIDNGKYLDAAGGFGILTRLLRDKGFDCYTTDKYCENIFSKNFEKNGKIKVDAVFCFEVLEHIDDPYLFFTDLFDRCNCKTVVFSTTTFEKQVPPKDWWYYSFETGQHITFFQPRTLSLLADRLKCSYHKISPSYHIITDRKISKIDSSLIANKYFRKIYGKYVQLTGKKKSKMLEDSTRVKESFNEDVRRQSA
jgi:hypothetical protein